MDSARGRFHFWAVTQARELGAYYAARNNGYTVPRAAPFAGKALALAPDVTQWLGHPRAPTPAARVPDREGRTAAPRRALPRTVRSRLACRLFYAPHSKHPECEPHGMPDGGDGFRSHPHGGPIAKNRRTAQSAMARRAARLPYAFRGAYPSKPRSAT